MSSVLSRVTFFSLIFLFFCFIISFSSPPSHVSCSPVSVSLSLSSSSTAAAASSSPVQDNTADDASSDSVSSAPPAPSSSTPPVADAVSSSTAEESNVPAPVPAPPAALEKEENTTTSTTSNPTPQSSSSTVELIESSSTGPVSPSSSSSAPSSSLPLCNTTISGFELSGENENQFSLHLEADASEDCEVPDHYQLQWSVNQSFPLSSTCSLRLSSDEKIVFFPDLNDPVIPGVPYYVRVLSCSKSTFNDNDDQCGTSLPSIPSPSSLSLPMPKDIADGEDKDGEAFTTESIAYRFNATSSAAPLDKNIISKDLSKSIQQFFDEEFDPERVVTDFDPQSNSTSITILPAAAANDPEKETLSSWRIAEMVRMKLSEAEPASSDNLFCSLKRTDETQIELLIRCDTAKNEASAWGQEKCEEEEKVVTPTVPCAPLLKKEDLTADSKHFFLSLSFAPRTDQNVCAMPDSCVIQWSGVSNFSPSSYPEFVSSLSVRSAAFSKHVQFPPSPVSLLPSHLYFIQVKSCLKDVCSEFVSYPDGSVIPLPKLSQGASTAPGDISYLFKNVKSSSPYTSGDEIKISSSLAAVLNADEARIDVVYDRLSSSFSITVYSHLLAEYPLKEENHSDLLAEIIRSTIEQQGKGKISKSKKNIGKGKISIASSFLSKINGGDTEAILQFRCKDLDDGSITADSYQSSECSSRQENEKNEDEEENTEEKDTEEDEDDEDEETSPVTPPSPPVKIPRKKQEEEETSTTTDTDSTTTDSSSVDSSSSSYLSFLMNDPLSLALAFALVIGLFVYFYAYRGNSSLLSIGSNNSFQPVATTADDTLDELEMGSRGSALSADIASPSSSSTITKGSSPLCQWSDHDPSGAVSFVEFVLSDLGLPKYGMNKYTSALKDNYLNEIAQLKQLDSQDWKRLGLPLVIEQAIRENLNKREELRGGGGSGGQRANNKTSSSSGGLSLSHKPKKSHSSSVSKSSSSKINKKLSLNVAESAETGDALDWDDLDTAVEEMNQGSGGNNNKTTKKPKVLKDEEPSSWSDLEHF